MLLMQGDPNGALQIVESSGTPELMFGIQAIAYHALGKTEEFKVAMTELMKLEGPEPYATLAEVYAFTGEIDLAFEALDKAIENNDRLQKNLFLPQWRDLRSDPRWTRLRETLDMSEEQLSVLDFSPH